MSDQQNEPIKQFARQAAALCAMLEDHCAYTPGELASTAANSLSTLITAATTLPDLAVDDSGEEVMIPKIDTATANYILRNADEKIGKASSHAGLIDSHPELATIPTDLTDLYRKLKPAQMLYGNGSGAGVPLAVREWKGAVSSAENQALVDKLTTLAQEIKANR